MSNLLQVKMGFERGGNARNQSAGFEHLQPQIGYLIMLLKLSGAGQASPNNPAVKSVGPLKSVRILNLVRLLRRPVSPQLPALPLPQTPPSEMAKRKCEFTSEESSAPVCTDPLSSGQYLILTAI